MPFVEPPHQEVVLKRLAKSNGATVPQPDRRIRTLYFQKDDRTIAATVGRPLRGDGRVVVAILPRVHGGHAIILTDPDGTIRKAAPITVAAEDVDIYSVKYFRPPNDAGTADDVQKRLAARRQLFGKVQATADTDGIAWGDALRKILINPANLPLLAQAQEPRKPRAPRQRLSDAELEKRIRQLEGIGDDIRKTSANSDVAIKPVRKSDGTVDEVATSIKKIHTTGGTVEAHRRK